MDPLICTTEQGKLKGKKDTNLDGKPFISFMGIPYAKPPVGQLRFKDPQPPENWDGIRDATKQGQCCYSLQASPGPEGGVVVNQIGSEDCLFLNVYTPKIPQTEDNELKPVMVYIHAGAFTSGSSDRSLGGPEFLMTEDIVLVTINYRLGALGFLVVDDPSLGVTGNAGLKDQVQALKWVQKNIKYFGGNPDNVTIFGESAGGAAVHYLVLSPLLAKGLFHKAIVQSGSALCPWARGDNNAQQLAQVLGCTETDNKKILEFLLQVPVEKILEEQKNLGDWLFCIEKRHFGPSIESRTENAFLSEDPLKLLESGNYNQVPLMIGYTSREGISEELLVSSYFEINQEEFVPYYFGCKRSSNIYKEINKKISKFYFDGEKPDPSNKEALYLLVTDVLFLRGIYFSAKAHAKTSQSPVYYYRLSLETDLNLGRNLVQTKTKGACHGDDLGYLFKFAGTVDIKPGSPEEIGVRRFVKMWTNFAKTGNPIPLKDSLLNAEWKSATPNEMNFLDIGTDLVPGTEPDIDRMNFWDRICKGIKKYF